MEDSFKGFKSSTTPPSAVRRYHHPYDGVSNENEVDSDDLGFSSYSKKKLSATKGSVSRNRILTESSNLGFPHFANTPNLDSQKKSPCFSSYSDLNFEDQNSSITDSSLKPYDPFTNYLSPRPKFMRYNPNRRRRIFLQRNNKIKELDDKTSHSFNTQKSVVEDELSICSSQENSAKVEGGKIEKGENNCCNDDNEEEEIEEFEEENCWSLKGILEFLLVIAVLFLSTVYISTMNMPALSYSVDESIWGSANGSHEEKLSEKVNAEILEGGNQIVLMELIQWNMSVEDDMKMKFVESSDGLGSMLEEIQDQLQLSKDGQKGYGYDAEFENSAQFLGTESGENFESFEDLPTYNPTIFQDEQYIDLNLEGENAKINDEINSVEEIAKEGNGEGDENGISSTEFVEMVTSESRLNKEDAVYIKADSNVERDENDFSSIEFDEVLTIESSLNKNEEHVTTIVDPEADSTEVNTKQTQINPISLKIVGFCILVAFLSLIYPKRKTRSSVVDAKNGSTAVDVKREKMDKSIGFSSPDSFIYSPVLAPNEFSDDNYSARRSNTKKRKVVGTEESSNNSGSGSVSPANGGSLSYGSFTAEKIVVKKKKQEGKDGEVNIVIPTPVRRSSRLHNKGIISP